MTPLRSTEKRQQVVPFRGAMVDVVELPLMWLGSSCMMDCKCLRASHLSNRIVQMGRTMTGRWIENKDNILVITSGPNRNNASCPIGRWDRSSFFVVAFLEDRAIDSDRSPNFLDEDDPDDD